jgi:hypothetical protein
MILVKTNHPYLRVEHHMLDDESPQEMFNRLKRLINKIRAYKSRKWMIISHSRG